MKQFTRGYYSLSLHENASPSSNLTPDGVVSPKDLNVNNRGCNPRLENAPEGAESLPRDMIKKPGIDIYIRDFGKKKSDFCMLAEFHGKTVGGAWLRILDGEIKGYGNIDSETPELAIAVFKPYQRMGIGTSLMYNIIDLTFNSIGYSQISLSVDKANYAVEMYKKFGFEMVIENGQDYIMVLKK